MQNSLVSLRSAGSAALGAMLLAAALVTAVAPARAQDDGGRGHRRGDRPQSTERSRAPQAPPSGERVRSGNRERGPGPAESGGQRQYQDRRGDRPQGDRGGHERRGEIGNGYRGNGGYGGGRHYGGGGYASPPRHYYGGGGYRAPYRARYARPHRVLRIGIGLGLPYYCPPSYRSYVVRRPFVREYVPSIDVENYPPAGCYYYDPYCEREFANLDDYTDHLDGADHSNIIEIVDESTGERVRVLEFLDGYWSVQR